MNDEEAVFVALCVFSVKLCGISLNLYHGVSQRLHRIALELAER